MSRRYMPSNGTEGDYFIAKFCGQCIHEKFLHTQREGDKCCKILSTSLLTSDPEGVEEWIYDENDKPTCTKWQHWDWGGDDGGELNEPPDIPPYNPNQLLLPFDGQEFTSTFEKNLNNVK